MREMSECARDVFEPTRAAIQAGDVLADKYEVERRLGVGGSGLVLLARHLQLGQKMAIKLLLRGPDASVAARFLSEARATARLQNDHVVRIFDVGQTEHGVPYIVMEHLEGEDLAQRLRTNGPVPAPLAVDWLLQACEGLAEAHHHGIVHRDLKPSNLFLERRPNGSARIKLLDFGIAKVPSSPVITEMSQFLGSPSYMAPEQIMDPRDVDARTDIWSLGVLLYELLTGLRPFVASSPLALARKVREEPHVAAVALRPEVPSALSAIVDRCLAKERDDRWPCVSALAQALEAQRAAGGCGLDVRVLPPAEASDPLATLDSARVSMPSVVEARASVVATTRASGKRRARRGHGHGRRALVALATLAALASAAHGAVSYRASGRAVTDVRARSSPATPVATPSATPPAGRAPWPIARGEECVLPAAAPRAARDAHSRTPAIGKAATGAPIVSAAPRRRGPGSGPRVHRAPAGGELNLRGPLPIDRSYVTK